MTPAQRDALQEKLDEFIWAYITASADKSGVPADRMFWAMMLREGIERRLDAETTP